MWCSYYWLASANMLSTIIFSTPPSTFSTTAPTTCSLTVADAIQLNFGPLAVQARPAESAALIRCICGLDTLAAPARACIKLRAFAPKVTVATAPDKRSWSGLTDVRLDDAVEPGHAPVLVVVEAVEVSVTSSTDTLAVSAKAKTTTVSGAVVSDLSVQATDDNVVVRAARADMEVTSGAPLSSIIEVTNAIQNGFACRAWDYLGVARADVEGEAVDFFAVETERTASICVDAVSGGWNGLRIQGHVSSDGVACSAVLEAARNGCQLLEPTLVHIKADGTITNAIADAALAMLEIDGHGLDEMDKRILETIIVKFNGGPVGVNSIAAAVGEEADTLEEVYEPFLIMEGYLQRTPQGRTATELGHQRLGLNPDGSQQQSLL